MVPLLGVCLMLDQESDARGRIMPKSPRKTARLPKDVTDLDSYNKEEHRRYWKEVLNEIYNYSPSEYGLGKNGLTDEHDLARKLKIPGQELMLSLSFLEDHALITYKDHNWIILTKERFTVALENEKFRNNTLIQAMSLFVTLLLVLTATFEFVNSTGLPNPYILLVFYSGSLAVAYIIAHRTFSKY